MSGAALASSGATRRRCGGSTLESWHRRRIPPARAIWPSPAALLRSFFVTPSPLCLSRAINGEDSPALVSTSPALPASRRTPQAPVENTSTHGMIGCGVPELSNPATASPCTQEVGPVPLSTGAVPPLATFHRNRPARFALHQGPDAVGRRGCSKAGGDLPSDRSVVLSAHMTAPSYVHFTCHNSACLNCIVDDR